MKPIQTLISEFIESGGLAHVTTQNGNGGVLFTDDNQFIPWLDLGYSSEYGFYQISRLPNIENEASYSTWSIHPLVGSENSYGVPLYVLLDADGYGFLLGERWQVAELLPVVQQFMATGEASEPVDDEVIGVKYYSIAEACAVAHEYDPAKYPYTTPGDQDRLRRRIQQLIRRGNIYGTKKDPQGFYRIRATAFRGWLSKRGKQP